MDSRTSAAIFTVLVFLISAGLLVYALWRAYCLLRLLFSSGNWATGSITSRKPSLFDLLFLPLQFFSKALTWNVDVAIYEFTTDIGERYTGGFYFFTYMSFWNPSRNQGPQTGDIFRIIYLKNNPAVNMTKSSIANKLWGAFLIIVSDSYFLTHMIIR